MIINGGRSQSDLKSDVVKKGIERAPHRALLYALGCTTDDMDRPFVGIVNSFSEIVPGHIHLRQIAEAVKAGVFSGGGVPFEVNTIAVCDGIAMNHTGMKYSLPSRELIADSVEIVAEAHGFDALVFVPNCDKIVPGMLMAAVRLNLSMSILSLRRSAGWLRVAWERRIWSSLRRLPVPVAVAVPACLPLTR